MKNIMISLVLIFFIFSSTTVIYAQITDSDDVYLDTISDYYLADETLVSKAGSTLIPEGNIRGVNDVYYVEYQYEVIVKEGMELQVMIEDLFFSNTGVSIEDLQSTFRFDISKTVVNRLDYSEHLFGKNEDAERVIITVKVSMVEPESNELYAKLIGGQLTFDVYFFAVNDNSKVTS